MLDSRHFFEIISKFHRTHKYTSHYHIRTYLKKKNDRIRGVVKKKRKKRNRGRINKPTTKR